MNKNNKAKIIIVLEVLFILGSGFLTTFNIISRNPNESSDDLNYDVKGAGDWSNFTYIHINGNWTIANETEWCSGSGTWADPYLIENITMNASSSPTGSGILIENSNAYFIIQNCTIFSAPDIFFRAGIHLENTNNGLLRYNNCSYNDECGILLSTNSGNNTISENILNMNLNSGILVYDNCNGNTISNNIGSSLESSARQNNGIRIRTTCTNNDIINNTFNYNSISGISFDETCNSHTIINNTLVGNNQNGIYLITNCDSNNIIDNFIVNNTLYGFLSSLCDNNLIYNNIFSNPDGENAKEQFGDNYFNNTEIGNFWHDYGGIDADDDGIGDTPYALDGGTDELPIWNDGYNGSKIHIDDSGASGNGTWEWAITRSWCSGSGTEDDPYVVEDCVINGSDDGSCIIIGNSSVYFRIENSTLYNAGSGGYDAGIKLYNTNNGTLLNNNCSYNDNSGILLYTNCDDNTIINNTANDNSLRGIYFYNNCDNNTLSNNTVYKNTGDAIRVENYCDNNTISNNNVSNQGGDDGIKLREDCNENKIINNTVYNNGEKGIYLRNDCDNNTISDNIMDQNDEGFRLYTGCDNNTITGNALRNNSIYGAYIGDGDCEDNLFFNNIFSNPDGINANDNGINNNWDNGVIGNYWSNYTGSDDDDDGIGDIPYNVSTAPLIQDNYPIWNDGNNGSKIFIEDDVSSRNWAWTSTRSWCTGSGTSGDPYVIQDATIDGQNSGHCIQIMDSNAYFRIENCTLYNAGSVAGDAGIRLDYAHNGRLEKNNISNNNDFGIYNDNSDEITVINNTINNNADDGIYFYGSPDYCANPVIQNNVITTNGGTGIYIRYSPDAIISGNLVDSSQGSNIAIYDISHNSRIFNNTAKNSVTNNGILVSYNCDNCDIYNNTLDNNFNEGIYIERHSWYTEVYDNTIINNDDNGIVVYAGGSGADCHYTKIINNTINNNDGDGISVSATIGGGWGHCFQTVIQNNEIKSNSDYGIRFDAESGCTIDEATISDNILDSNDGGIILVRGGDDAEIFNNIVKNCVVGHGIRFQSSPQRVIMYNNTIFNTQQSAIFSSGGDLFEIYNNTVYGSITGAGISLYEQCDSNTVYNNTIYNNFLSGVIIRDQSDGNIIENNTIHNNDQGIEIYTSSNTNNKLRNNIIYDNTNYGIELTDGSDSTTISGNTITGEVTAIRIYNADNNFICSNNLTGNTNYIVFEGSSTGNKECFNYKDGIYSYGAIDDNGGTFGAIMWVEAAYYWWCDGSGTYADPYVIEDMTIDGMEAASCIEIRDSTAYFRIENCTFTNCTDAFFAAGIRLDNTDNGAIINNNCSYNDENGIFLDTNSDNNTISGNTVNMNSFHGIVLYDNCDSNTILNNNASSLKSSAQQDNGVHLEFDCDNNDIINNTFNDNSLNGIYIDADCDYNDIINNTANDNNQRGIALYDNCDHNNISYNTANENTWDGILLSINCDNNSILNNTITENVLNGIILVNACENNTISLNNISTNTQDGIQIDAGYNNSIFNNTIFNNTRHGISLNSTTNTTITGNIISNNTEIGLLCEETANWSLIYYNNFTGNGIHSWDNGSNNRWDNGSIGNYWDNYSMVGGDYNDNGIGDLPYINPGSAGSQDNYPIWEDGDDNPPEIEIISPVANDLFGVVAPNFTVVFTDRDLNTTWYTIDGGSNNYTITNNGTINQTAWDGRFNGTVTITFYANDSAGRTNFSEVVVRIDIIAPFITINSPEANDLFGINAPDFNISFVDNHLNDTWYTIDGGSNNYTFTVNGTINQTAWDGRANGTVTIKFYANDTIGNLNSSEVIVLIDIIAPNITIIAPLANENFGYGAPDFNITILEANLNTTWYFFDDEIINYTFSGLEGTINQSFWDSMDEGYHTLRFYANDTVGNVGFNECVIIKFLHYWTLDPFVIDDSGGGNYTWAEVAFQKWWCNGSGTFLDPYIIENVTIIGNGSKQVGDVCLTIRDSTAFFIIRNCTFSNYGVGVYFDEVDNGQILNNSNSFTYHQYGLYFYRSEDNTVSGSRFAHNYYGLYLHESNYNNFSWDVLSNNTIDIEQVGCTGNRFDNMFYDPVGGDTPPPDDPPPEEFPLIIIIIIAIIALSAIGGLVVVKKSKKQAPPSEEQKKELQIKAKKALRTKPSEVKGDIKGKKKVSAEGAPPADLTEEEKQELARTEAEVGVQKTKFICVVHKGPIKGNIYICHECDTIYCQKCALTLKEKGEKCWSCESELNP